MEFFMKTSDSGLHLMHQFEGFRNKPYLCPAHIWTCGWGTVLYQDQIRLPMVRVEGKDVPMIRREYPLRAEDNRVWSKEELAAMFKADLETFERAVLRLIPGVSGRQGCFDALVSLAYNIGSGNLQRSQIRIKANRGEWQQAADHLMDWTKGGGRVLPGLVKRRKAERELFLSSL
jgi:lysozyme